jgi:hypothetical protein
MHPATRRLVVFLSSVRRSLEQERDNLPALIGAIDLQPKVARALAELAAQQAPLVFTPLPATADVTVRGSTTPLPGPGPSRPTARSWNATQSR